MKNLLFFRDPISVSQVALATKKILIWEDIKKLQNWRLKK